MGRGGDSRGNAGGNGSSGGGKSRAVKRSVSPRVLEHTSSGNPYSIDFQRLYPFPLIQWKDRDLSAQFHWKFWNGSEYTSSIPTGWSYREELDTLIRFHTTDPAPVSDHVLIQLEQRMEPAQAVDISQRKNYMRIPWNYGSVSSVLEPTSIGWWKCSV